LRYTDTLTQELPGLVISDQLISDGTEFFGFFVTGDSGQITPRALFSDQSYQRFAEVSQGLAV
jgi:hypothetical protein